MRRSNFAGELLPLDPEIDRTFHRRKILQKQQEEQEHSIMANRPLKDYATPYARGFRSSISRPSVEANNFEIKPVIISMVQQNQFGGGPHEDPNQHLEVFYEICGTMKMNGVPLEAVHLLLFGFSLRDRAKQWLNYLALNSITT